MSNKSTKNHSAFRAASSWKIYPTPGQMWRLFYRTPKLEGAINDRSGIVIGRKGTGKSAFAQYLKDSSPDDTEILNFGRFPFAELKSLREEGLVENCAFVNAWKSVILQVYLRYLVQVGAFDQLFAKKLGKLLSIDPTLALEKSLRRWSNLEFSLSALGLEGVLSGSKSDFGELALSEKVTCLEALVERATQSRTEFTIIFDELDMGFAFLGSQFSDSDYAAILSSLLRASSEMTMSVEGRKLNSLVLIRDDIFDVLNDPDKNKWLDEAAVLEWSRVDLVKMIDHLLQVSIEDSVMFEDLFDLSIRQSKILLGGDTRLNVRIIEYFFECTHLRPRDVIMFFRELSKVALEANSPTFNSKTVSAAERKYSERLKQEIIDEVHTVLPEVSKVFDALSYSGRVRFNKEEFYSLLSRVSEGKVVDQRQMERWTSILYYFSVIGVVGHSSVIYKCERPGSKYIGQKRLELHPGLRMSINFNH